MVKILSIFMATLAAISPVAQAGVWHCTPGLCQSWDLAINAAPIVDFPGAEKLEEDALYNCVSPQKVGDMRLCRWGCDDRSAGRSDHSIYSFTIFTTSNLTMVKILSIFMATLAAISPVVQARACIPGNNYCGSTLTTFGKAALP
ncbi:hypothetical protein E4U49_000256 [Claviceps purpurea]|nr:hypothetical protein E4U49_000256 [Claviceps purpurea]